MRGLLREHAAPPAPPPPEGRSVLSVGAGTGHFDAELLGSALPDVTRWVGVEPNAAQAARLRATMAALPPAVARRLRAPPEIREAPFDAAFVAAARDAGERHDLVLFTHCLYHMDPAAGAVAMALPLLRPRGRVVVLNQTDEGMCAYVRRFRPRWAYVDRQLGRPCAPLADHCLSVESLADALRAALKARGDDKSYLWHEDRIVVPSDRVPALLKWTHESSGHVGVDRTLRLFKQWFHTTWTDDQLRKTLQPIVDKCPCRSCKPGDIRDRGLYSTLPIPHCANSVLYVDYTEMPKFGGYDFALVETCGLIRFTRVFPCTKHITGEETIKILLEEWFCVYGAPKEINSDEDVRVRSDTGWYKRVLRSLNVQVSTGFPYSHTSNPLCERQIRVLKENVRIWCKTERTRDWVRLLPVIFLMMNSQESSATGYSPHELFLGRPAWFLHAPYPEDTHSSVGEWVQEQQAKVDKAKAMLQRVRERQWNKKNKHRVPATYQEGDWVLVHHSRLPAWPRSTSNDPYFGPYKILSVDGHRITVRCSPRLGGTLVCAAQHLKRYYDPEDLCGEEWELNDEEIAALDLQGAASPMEVEGELPDMNAEEMAKEGFYLVKSFLRHRFRQGWRFLTLWEGFGVEEATWEPFSAFVLPEGRLNSVLVDYLSQNNLGELLRLAETLASKTKARD